MAARVSLLAALAAIVVLAAAGVAVSAVANPPTGGPSADGAEVALPRTRREEFVSKINGHRYQISVALPFREPPPRGYAVLYVLDGYWYFASAAEVVRVLGNPTRIVVVGIGYPDDAAYAQSVSAQRGPVPASLAELPLSRSSPYLEREYDLTLPASGQELAAQALPGLPGKSHNVGGLDEFLQIVEREVKPRVAVLAPIDSTNQALFGHSLGGLAALHALFVEPNAFRTFIVASPSIWWNNKEVLTDESRFAEAVTSGRAHPRVLVTVGSEESAPVKFPASWGLDNGVAQARLRKMRVVENVQELVARLKALHGPAGYRVEGAVFAKESHSASPWSALSRGIYFAFAGEGT